ncbi:hypothetical protein EON62_05940, partial [archaeon]
MRYVPPRAAAVAAAACWCTLLRPPTPHRAAHCVVLQIKDLFADKLAKDTGVAREEVDVSCYHVVDAAGRALSNDTIIAAALKDYDEISICDGPAPAVTAPLTTSQLPPTSSAAGAGEARVGSGGVTCRNFGCMKSYSEADNHDAACVHHAGPPVFHEGKKCWSCCRDKLAWDWEEFMAIPGCVTSAHSNVPPAVSTPVAASPSTDAAADTPTPTPIKSIADYNAANPDAPTAVTSLVKTLSTAKTKLVVREDGKKRCVHFGCQRHRFEVGALGRSTQRVEVLAGGLEQGARGVVGHPALQGGAQRTGGQLEALHARPAVL